MKRGADIGLQYVKVNLKTARNVFFTEASFANARSLKSQLGYPITLLDDEKWANIINFGSQRGRRVLRSVMPTEIHALVLRFDQTFSIQSQNQQRNGRLFEIEFHVYNRTLFNMIPKDGQNPEKRLQIDIFGLRESYSAGEIGRLSWIPGTNNPADALTRDKFMTTSPLTNIVSTNIVDIQEIGWANVTHEHKSTDCQN